MHILRDYQLTAIDALRSKIREGKRRLLLVAPTGSGKTTIAAEMIHRATERGKRLLFIAHRKELIEQCSQRLDDLGLDHGIIKADHPRRKPWLNIHVASIATLVRRKLLASPDLIFIDEAHRARAASYLRILHNYPDAVCVGLTATPIRSDGKGLGEIFEAMIQCPSVRTLTEEGYLVPCRVYAPATPDVSTVKTTGGDFDEGQLANIMDKPRLIGDILEHWTRLASPLITVVFAVTRQHSRNIVDKFVSAGITAEHLDGETPDNERTAILRRVALGTTRVVSNVGVLTEGWDVPAVACGVCARPTQSLGLHLQMIGRILRPWENKPEALLLDHAGNTSRHGFADDDQDWTLDYDQAAVRRKKVERSESVRVCMHCFRSFLSSLGRCPECGWSGTTEPVIVAPGTLEEKARPVYVKGVPYEVKKFSEDPEIARLQRFAAERGYKPGWVWRQRQAMQQANVDSRQMDLEI